MAISSKMAINKFLKLIQAEHQKYFISEDEVLKEGKDLEELRIKIKKYLGLVKNENKFTCETFAQLFKYNFEKKPDFNVKDAQQAFDNLQKYASNLINYPWRKEFRTIKLYCGFFKHQIARHLLKADSVLRLIGYVPSSSITSSLILDEPLDPDKLIMVSLNCIIASCECEVIHDIYLMVKSSKCSCTYKEIYTVRQTISNSQAIAQSFCSKDRKESSSPVVSKYSLKNQNGNAHQFVKNEKNLKKDAKVGQLIDISPITTSTPETKKKQILPDDLYSEDSGHSKDYSTHRPSQTNNSFDHKKFEKNENGVYTNVTSQNKEKSLIDDSEDLKFHVPDDHVKPSSAAVREHRKQELEEPPPTRDASWSYVDKALQSRGLNRGYANRNDVLDEVGPTKPDKELEMLRRKSRESEHLQYLQQQLHLQQLQQQQVSHFHANPVVQNNSSEYMPFNNYPPPMQQMPPAMMPPGYPYVNNPYVCNPEMMRNASLMRNMHSIPDYPSETQWMQMRNQCISGMYYPTPATTVDGSAALPNNFVSAMQTMNLIDNSRVENGTRSQETNTPLSDPSEENRRSFYDNVPPDRDGRVPDSYSASSYLPGIMHPMMYMSRPHPLPPMAGFPGRPVEASSDYYGSELREKLHRKDSQTGMDEQIESDGIHKLKHQFEKTKNKVDSSDMQYASGNKEKSSPGPPRRSRSETPSVHSSKRNSQCSSESVASNWECKHCTFLNPGEKKICDMCGRSKTVGPESRPLQCGGHECPKCTLINDMNAKICIACGATLENSPTYL